MWLRVDIRYGPGRHGYHEEYLYFDDNVKLTKQLKEDIRNEVKEQYDDFEDGFAVCDFEKLKKLPEKIKEEKIRENEKKIKNAKKMLEILKKS